MRRLLKKSIAYYKVIIIICIIVMSFVYAATQMILSYYYNDIISGQNLREYQSCEIYLSKPIKVKELQSFEQYCNKHIKGYKSSIYVIQEDSGYNNIAIQSKKEIYKEIDELNSGEAIVNVDYLSKFHSQYPEYKCIKSNEVLVYGCTPLLVGSILPFRDVEDKNTLTVVVESTKVFKTRDYHSIKSQLKKIDKEAQMIYMTKRKWLRENLSYYKTMFILMIAVMIFTIASVGILVKYLLERQTKEMVVFLICGASSKQLKRYYFAEQGFMQMISLIVGNGIAIFLMKYVGVFEFTQIYIVPIFCCVSISLICSGMIIITIKKMLSKDIYTYWRRLG